MCPLPEALIIEGFAYVKQATIFYLFLVVVVDAVALVVLKKISVQMTKPPTNHQKEVEEDEYETKSDYSNKETFSEWVAAVLVDPLQVLQIQIHWCAEGQDNQSLKYNTWRVERELKWV